MSAHVILNLLDELGKIDKMCHVRPSRSYSTEFHEIGRGSSNCQNQAQTQSHELKSQREKATTNGEQTKQYHPLNGQHLLLQQRDVMTGGQECWTYFTGQ